jgi:hypothetical protein
MGVQLVMVHLVKERYLKSPIVFFKSNNKQKREDASNSFASGLFLSLRIYPSNFAAIFTDWLVYSPEPYS